MYDFNTHNIVFTYSVKSTNFTIPLKEESDASQQGVTLYTTGPPSLAPSGELRYICAVLQTTTDDDDARRQRPLLVWPSTLRVGGPVTVFCDELFNKLFTHLRGCETWTALQNTHLPVKMFITCGACGKTCTTNAEIRRRSHSEQISLFV